MLISNIAKAVIKNKIGIVSYPSFITFLVTWRCNAKCIFCDVWKKNSNYENELNLEEIKKIFKQLKKIDVLRLSGGEPFLRKDLAEIINIIEEVNPPEIIHLTTNGTLTSQIIESFKKIKPLNKIHIKVSIDNIGEKHDKTRGISGAYEKAMETIKQLHKLKQKENFHIGVNQAITEEKEISSYFELRKILKPFDVPVYPVIANEPTNSLYSDKNLVNPNNSFKTFGYFSKEKLKEFVDTMIKHGKEVNNTQEQIIDRYHLRGLFNRLVKNKMCPNPKCVALNNHLRILPNGDIPVCLYNSFIIGNLKNNNFNKIWNNEKAKKQREWIKKCPGCWQSCESAVNAIYTGDIWKGFFY